MLHHVSKALLEHVESDFEVKQPREILYHPGPARLSPTDLVMRHC